MILSFLQPTTVLMNKDENRMKIELIGVSENIIRIRKLIDRVADTDLNIMVCGETGVGKEVVVRSLYEKSNRCGKPFVKVNCAALPDRHSTHTTILSGRLLPREPHLPFF
jgi:transcriptional regulator with GAF, ATPase, and Fis domain